MPKDRRTSSFGTRASPYSCSTRNADDCRLKDRLQSIGDEKEWEEARCPMCMEHPHSAVLLLCTCLEKGCRPYVCNTSSLHSNCLHQFLKSSVVKSSDNTTEEVNSLGSGVLGGDEEQAHRGLSGAQLKPKYLCPLCRGEFTSWMVVEPARKFMNGKKRSCSHETCDFSGTYRELRNHAKHVHPSVRPSETDPERVREWTRLERERDLQDVLIHNQNRRGGNDMGLLLTEILALTAVQVLLNRIDGEEVRFSVGVVGSSNATSVPEWSSDDTDGSRRSDSEDDLGSSAPMDVGVEQPSAFVELSSMTFGFLPETERIPSRVHATGPTTPRGQRIVPGESGGGSQSRNRRTTARMSVRDISGRQFASRGGGEGDWSWGRRSHGD